MVLVDSKGARRFRRPSRGLVYALVAIDAAAMAPLQCQSAPQFLRDSIWYEQKGYL